MADPEIKVTSFFGLLRESFKEGLWKAWAVFGAVGTVIPFLVTLLHRHWPPIADIRWVKWVSDYQAEIQIAIAGAVIVAYLIYAPYRLQRDRLIRVIGERNRLKSKAEQQPLTGIRLRNECDKWIESAKAIYERLHNEGGEAAIPEAKQWLYDFKEFTELNLSVSDFDAVNYSNRAGEVFFAELAKLEPSKEVQMYKNLLAHRFGRLSVIRNSIK